MKIYNEEFVQKVFEVTEGDYISVDESGSLYSFSSKPKVPTDMSYWDCDTCHSYYICKVDLNGMDWKDSLRVRKWVPKEGEIVYISEIFTEKLYYRTDFLKSDYLLYERGFVHKTPEEAIACSKRMLEAAKKG